jgi:hypothetical protein
MGADKLVQALSVAWGGVQLYPDPAAVPAFVQAVDTIGEFANSSVVLTVGVDGFEVGSEVVPTAHGAADRLVQALFAHRVESLKVQAAPTPEEIINFFETVAEDAKEGDLDLPTRLELSGLTAIRIRCHDLLEDRDDDEEDPTPAVERDPEVQALFEADSVQRLAERIMEAESPEAAAVEFVEIFRRSYEKVTDGDPAGLERVVQSFVDAFFRLDHDVRGPIFGSIVDLREEPAFQNFLDQLSADEMEELAAEVDNSALSLLIEYARVVTEMQGRDPGLVAKVMGSDRALEARGTVGTHLAEFLSADATHAASAETIAAEVAALDDHSRLGWAVLSDLFAIEERNERLRRMLRIWVAKMNGALKSKAFSDAIAWLDVVRQTELDPRLVDEAYNHLASDENLKILTTGEADDSDLRDELLQELSHRAGDRVLERLAAEEDPGRRHLLVDVVTEIARVDLRSVLLGLNDPRWFVVRNLTIALGKSGRKAAAGPLADLSDHEDHRVRMEALRALLLCLGPASVDHLVAGLADDHPRVQSAAAYLLATLDDEQVIPALGAVLRDEGASIQARVAAIQALGRRSNQTGDELLREVAETRVRFSQSARALRSAARTALRSGHA